MIFLNIGLSMAVYKGHFYLYRFGIIWLWVNDHILIVRCVRSHFNFPLCEEKPLEQKSVFCFSGGRFDQTRKTYADTRWGFQRWLSSRDGHCRRACTCCSLLPLCCVCSYKPACCDRSSRTRWHGHYTCTWVGRRKVTDRSGAKGHHTMIGHTYYMCTHPAAVVRNKTKQAQTCRKAVQTQSSDDVCWAYHWNVTAPLLSDWVADVCVFILPVLW